MKKLYKKGTIHPSPQIKSDDQLLSLFPVAIFSLAAVLSPQDREVLAYLISTASYSSDRSSTSRLNKTKPYKTSSRFDNHSPLFHCDCFTCYTSYWVRWDSSPSRQLIHEIIDAYEDSLEEKKKKKKKVTGKKDRRKRSGKSLVLASPPSVGPNDSEVPSQLNESTASSSGLVDDTGSFNGGLESKEEVFTEKDVEEAAKEEEEKGPVRRFVSFIGEKVFGAWG